MSRKRLTQYFPWLLPLRQKQRRLFYFTAMKLDRNTYAVHQSKQSLPNKIYEDRDLMINRASGFDIQFQYNKVHNLTLAAEKISGIIIAPGETFSLCYAIRNADKKTPYLEGLSFLNGETIGEYGGGLCQLSILFHRIFLHTPLTVTERHGHETVSIPPTNGNCPSGIDATIAEGWLDLRVKNETPHKFQLCIRFDGDDIIGEVYSDAEKCYDYQVYNPSLRYEEADGEVFEIATVARRRISILTGEATEEVLYENVCAVNYPLPENTVITKREAENEV